MSKKECAGCGDEGCVNPIEASQKGICLLAEDDNGVLWCLPCYCQAASICLHCGKQADIMPDTTCKAEPWLCEECLSLPYRIHMFSCYLDGCMTPEEFAAEAQREIDEGGFPDVAELNEGEEWKESEEG